MSNVKLVILKSKLPKFAMGLIGHIDIFDAYGLDRDQICRKIFRNYGKLYIVLTPITTLPVPEYANHPDLKNTSEKDFRDFLFGNSSTRTYSDDDIKYYDVYKLWWLSESIPITKVPIDKLMEKNYGTTTVEDITDIWGYRYTELPPDELKRIQGADLKYPILIDYSFKSIDGHHRTIKCKINGCASIAVIKIPRRVLKRAWISDWVSGDEYDSRFVRDI
jgi:hypothetical protein